MHGSTDQSLMGAITLPPEAESAGEARRYMAGLLRQAGCDAEISDTALLLVSELVTNAIVHARTWCQVTFDVKARSVSAAVADGSPSPVVPSQPDTADTSGRGLCLLERLADEWGWRPSGAGKMVWFEVRLRPVG